MKTIKMIALVAMLALTSCEKEEISKGPDCECDKVVWTDYVKSIKNGVTIWEGYYITINECADCDSKTSFCHKSFSIKLYNETPPMVGDCK